MSRQKPKTPALPLEVLGGDLAAFTQAIGHQNDLACALVTTSYLEQCLASLLRGYFIENCTTADFMFDHSSGGLLTDLSAKAKMSYCLGLIDGEMFGNLTTIMSIRNRFGHIHPELTFDDETIKTFCKNLKFPLISPNSLVIENPSIGADIPSEDTVVRPMTQSEFESMYDSPKNRYKFVAASSAMIILASARTVKRCNHKTVVGDP